VVTAIVAGIAIVSLIRAVGESGSSSSPARPPGVGETLPSERSAAADVLASKDWMSMSDAERTLVHDETQRVYNDATFRATQDGSDYPTDIFIRGGKTVVSRAYERTTLDNGKNVLGQALIFYCDKDPQTVTQHAYGSVPGNTQYGAKDGDTELRPWQPVLTNAGWDVAKDLGFKDIDSRTAHGLEMPYHNPGQTETTQVEYWFENESARLVEFTALNPEGRATFSLNWAKLPPVTVPGDQPHPDCVDQIVQSVAQ
jgi:hypothetical protein